MYQQERNKMTDKALISAFTYRSLESQRASFGDMPIFVLPDDLPQLFRPSTRKTNDRFHVESLAVIAKYEEDFRDFLDHAKLRKAQIVSREDNQTFSVNGNCENLVKWWKDARRNGDAMVGAKNSAEQRKSATKEAINKIKDRWPMSSKEWPTSVLLKEAGKSLNTVKSVLGSRIVAQANYRAKMKRKTNAKR